MRKYWWKILCVILIAYSIIAGLHLPVPKLPIVEESIRNLYYHVPMWFAMTALFIASMVYSIMYLNSSKLQHDLFAASLARIGILFSILGMVTGMEWAHYTWSFNQPDASFFWTGDPKQLCAAISMLIYFAYFVLRSSIQDDEKKAKISSVYNIFACAIMIPLLYIIPRMTESLHPGSDGNNPADPKNLDTLMRIVFWPAVLGWVLMGLWISGLHYRITILNKKYLFHD